VSDLARTAIVSARFVKHDKSPQASPAKIPSSAHLHTFPSLPHNLRLGSIGAPEISPPRRRTIPGLDGFLSSQGTQNVITKGVVKHGQAARITQTLYFIAHLRELTRWRTALLCDTKF
jgi:hypothetical protein